MNSDILYEMTLRIHPDDIEEWRKAWEYPEIICDDVFKKVYSERWGLKHGVVESYWNGSTYTGDYVEGKLHGLYTERGASGQIYSQCEYIHNKKDGLAHSLRGCTIDNSYVQRTLYVNGDSVFAMRLPFHKSKYFRRHDGPSKRD